MLNHKESSHLVTAENAGDTAFDEVITAIASGQNFKLEAAAGAGKTHTLIQALRWVLNNHETYLPFRHQRIACLTYTNVACDEIVSRTDSNPLVFVSTLHGFLWEMISPYQKTITHIIPQLEQWQPLLLDRHVNLELKVEYDLGIRKITEDAVSLHHDDVPKIAIALFKMPKFRKLISDRFPIVFIDEYQDTPEGLIQSILPDSAEDQATPVVGLFGDDWQTIYDNRCGSVQHPSIKRIDKQSNFRSDRIIVDFLNRMRPELPQTPTASAQDGLVSVYHTNAWPGARLKRHFKSQISHQAVKACLQWLASHGHSADNQTKTLMLTHSVIANEVGYPNIPKVYRDNSTFARKEDPVIAYLLDVLEPAIEAFQAGQYGSFFQIIAGNRPTIGSPADKQQWFSFFTTISSLRYQGRVADVLNCIFQQELFAVPTAITDLQRQADEYSSGDQDQGTSRRLSEYMKLKEIEYAEIVALHSYLEGSSPFSTKHSVKGAEFEDVIVVVGRGWSKYDFEKMLSMYKRRNALAKEERAKFEVWRNLFYVAVSRAKHRLTLLIAQELSRESIETLADWVGDDRVFSFQFLDETTVSEVTQGVG